MRQTLAYLLLLASLSGAAFIAAVVVVVGGVLAYPAWRKGGALLLGPVIAHVDR